VFALVAKVLLLQAKSAEYNADLHVHTVRYAMLEQLRNPPAGKHYD